MMCGLFLLEGSGKFLMFICSTTLQRVSLVVVFQELSRASAPHVTLVQAVKLVRLIRPSALSPLHGASSGCGGTNSRQLLVLKLEVGLGACNYKHISTLQNVSQCVGLGHFSEDRNTRE
jgi:hypothetical protein